MDRPGDEFLARSRFALDQDGRVVQGGGPDGLHDLRQGRAPADHLEAREFPDQFLPFGLQFFLAIPRMTLSFISS